MSYAFVHNEIKMDFNYSSDFSTVFLNVLDVILKASHKQNVKLTEVIEEQAMTRQAFSLQKTSAFGMHKTLLALHDFSDRSDSLKKYEVSIHAGITSIPNDAFSEVIPRGKYTDYRKMLEIMLEAWKFYGRIMDQIVYMQEEITDVYETFVETTMKINQTLYDIQPYDPVLFHTYQPVEIEDDVLELMEEAPTGPFACILNL